MSLCLLAYVFLSLIYTHLSSLSIIFLFISHLYFSMYISARISVVPHMSLYLSLYISCSVLQSLPVSYEWVPPLMRPLMPLDNSGPVLTLSTPTQDIPLQCAYFTLWYPDTMYTPLSGVGIRNILWQLQSRALTAKTVFPTKPYLFRAKVVFKLLRNKYINIYF